MHIQFPVYRRGNTLVLHVRIAGRQIKRSLRTLDPNLAKVRATQMLGQLLAGELASTQPAAHAWSAMNPQSCDAATPDDLLTPELALTQSCGTQTIAAPSINASNPSNSFMGRRVAKLPDHEKYQLTAVFAEYGQIKKLRQVTQNDYASYGKEMVEFWGNRDIRTLGERDISDLIIHLRSTAGNDPRTIDNKTGYVRAVINFLIKHGRHPGPNPAADKNLVSKREKRKAGTKPFAYNDLKVVFGGEAFQRFGAQRPEIYLIVMVGLVTGMRVSSVARLTAADLKRSMHGTPYIDISNDKTIAGNRDIPIPELLFKALGDFFDDAIEQARQARAEEETWPKLHYLWPQHPIMEWLGDRVLTHFGRHRAPLLQSAKLNPGEQAFIFMSLVPNRKGQPLMVEWQVATRVGEQAAFKLEPFESFAERAGLQANGLPNRGQNADYQSVVSSMQVALPDAVATMHDYMAKQQSQFAAQLETRLKTTLEELKRLQDKQIVQLELRLENQIETVKRSRFETRSRQIGHVFDDYRNWVQDTLTTEPKPWIQVLAAVANPVV